MIRGQEALLRRGWILVALFVSCLFASLAAFAQTAEPVPPPSGTAAASPTSKPKPSAPAPAPTASETRVASTPRRSFAAFLRAAEAHDFTKAAEYLDLRGLARSRLEREGPELAAMLYRVLSWRVALSPETLPDEETPPGLGADGVVLDVVDLDGQSYTLALTPVKQPSGEVRWQF
ncbi:MAG: hypothetical protein JNK04_17390, partial [Myxococcales bacterium]|nr:hypothetical protein [Myxococcales bacterium]